MDARAGRAQVDGDVRLGNPKRYGVYLPSRASLYEMDISFDSCNVWEYMTPGFTVGSGGSSTDTSESSESTPAQQIAIRYRAAHASHLAPSRSDSESTRDSEPDSWDKYPQNDKFETDKTPPPARNLKAVYRQSRQQALGHTVRCLGKMFPSHLTLISHLKISVSGSHGSHQLAGYWPRRQSHLPPPWMS